MNDNVQSLRRKLSTAGELRAVVRTMKALAASSVTRFERSVEALVDYDKTVQLALSVFFADRDLPNAPEKIIRTDAVLIAFGSDQGLVGQFNESVLNTLLSQRSQLPATTTLICVGDRLFGLLANIPFSRRHFKGVPNTVASVTPLVNELLALIESTIQEIRAGNLWLLSNRPAPGNTVETRLEKLLPLHEQISAWRSNWPGRSIPDRITGNADNQNEYLLEYLFVTLFKACAESVVAENKSRMIAMQRAEKNIDELSEVFHKEMMHLRQEMIDGELFDVIAGYESISTNF